MKPKMRFFGGWELKVRALAYATSDRGACHLRSTFYAPELKGIIHPEQIEGKAEIFIDYEERLALYDALILCRFYRDIVGWDEISKIVHGTTGMALDKKELKEKAANIINATRRFNLQEGITSKDGPRLSREPKHDGRGWQAGPRSRHPDCRATDTLG